MAIDTNKTYTATMKTSRGEIVLELFTKDAPKTVNNFVVLSRDGFYDGLNFHRVLANFMIQGGCPQGSGSGGPGYKFEDEVRNRAKPAHVPVKDDAGAASWPFAEVIRTVHEVVIDDLSSRFGPLPVGRWGARPERAIVLPLVHAGQSIPYAFLVAGISPHRVFDDRYRRFFQVTRDQVANVIANVRAYLASSLRSFAAGPR